MSQQSFKSVQIVLYWHSGGREEFEELFQSKTNFMLEKVKDLLYGKVMAFFKSNFCSSWW
jgi:hypothetical protein